MEGNGRPHWETGFRVEAPAVNSRLPNWVATEKPVYLRLTRRGKVFAAEASQDGMKWKTLKSHDVAAPEKVQLGLFAQHSSDRPQQVTFSDYAVEALK